MFAPIKNPMQDSQANSTVFNNQLANPPLVAIVILNWNGRKFLEQFLPSVLASTYTNKRVILADNASTDDSVAFVKEHFPAVEIIINPENQGFARGYNTVLKQVQSDYYVLLNSDVEVRPDWIEPVIELMESDPEIGACQPKLLAWHQRSHFEYAGAAGGWLDHLGYPFARGRVFENIEEDRGQYDDAAPCFWASGAAMFVRANLYHELGGLDSWFFAHQEEIDFCWRMQLAGYKIYVQPRSVVYHVGGGTLPQGNSRKTRLNFRNNLVMLWKNSSAADRVWKMPLRFTLDGVAAWRALLTGDGGFFGAVLKAHLQFIGWFLMHRKDSVYPIRRRGTLRGWLKASLVWRYYLKKQDRFDKIVGNK